MKRDTLKLIAAWLLLASAACSNTSAPTPIMPPAVTSSPQPTTTLAPIATLPTALPTQSSDEVLTLVKTNGGCQLPCWWGIVPGDTATDSVAEFAASFGALAIHVLLDEIGNFRIRVPDGDVQPELDVVYGPLQGDTVEWLRVSALLNYRNAAGEYEIRDEAADPKYLDYYPAYTMAAVLTTYGKPDTVLLNGDAVNVPGLPWVFALTLVYPEKGIWVSYFGRMGGEPNFSICPMKTAISMWLWEPGRYKSLEEVRSMEIPISGWETGLGELTTLEEKTDLSLDEFYTTFREATRDSCFQSPTDRWYSTN